MKKQMLSLLAASAALLSCPADADTLGGEWKMYNTFEKFFKESIDTPSKVYLLTYGQMHYPDPSWGAWCGYHGNLFSIDKATGEYTEYNTLNKLNHSVILDIAYNSAKGYLLIVYTDYNIDILTDAGEVYAIHGLDTASLGASKHINTVTFDPERNKAYLGGDFGYCVIDDSQKAIVSVQQFNTPINAVGRVGDKVYIGTSYGLYAAPEDDPSLSAASFVRVDAVSTAVNHIMPLTDNTFGMGTPEGVFLVSVAGDGSVTCESKDSRAIEYFSENRDGYFMRRYGCTYQLTRQGELSITYTDRIGYPTAECSSWDMKDFYFPILRECVRRMRHEGSWADDTRDYVPAAPAVYAAMGLEYSPTQGMVISNDTFNRIYSGYYMEYYNLISLFKEGKWTSRSAMYSDSPVLNKLENSYSAVIDPLDPDVCWVGSLSNGVSRINLADNTGEMYANPSNAMKDREGFHAVFPDSPSWKVRCNVATPAFDGDGNMWTVFNPSHAGVDQPVYCWPAADRLADNVQAFKNVPVSGYTQHYDTFTLTATTHPDNKGFFAFAPSFAYANCFHLLYHGGTPADTSDDKFLSYNTFTDQDNNNVPVLYYNKLIEDPQTGHIWVLSDCSLFSFDPNEALAAGDTGGRLKVYRPKIGGEYLLDRMDVMCMTSDGDGNKWWGTNGGGVVVTTADGGRILKEFNTGNAPLPSDKIYGIGYDPSENTVWIGTSDQITSLRLDGSAAGEQPASDRVSVFPDVVTPSYQGHVYIQGLRASAATITDAEGKTIAALDVSGKGTAVWRLTDTQGKPVRPGTYYIRSKGVTTPAKIRVMR